MVRGKKEFLKEMASSIASALTLIQMYQASYEQGQIPMTGKKSFCDIFVQEGGQEQGF